MGNAVCSCGKPEEDFEDCPICGEKLCIDCEDWERFHREEDDGS